MGVKQLKRIPVTKEGFEKLQKELESLKLDRPNAVKTLAEARSLGDLSENGLYTAAKARLRSIDSQIFRLEMQIKLADIVFSKGQKTVGIGSSVVVDDGVSTKTFHIVGDFEASPKEGKISQHSPLGKALIGRKTGDLVSFEIPSGKVSYTIKSVS